MSDNNFDNQNDDDILPATIPIQTNTGLRLSALNPKYLHTNSTSHTWPFSAIAELVDNAYDPDVKASQLYIDFKYFKDELTLTFTDNGNGMDINKLYKMISFGFCEKVTIKGHMPVGHYGNGFKSGSMRLGKDALVLTKCKSSRSIAFLSQTYLEKVKADTIMVPIVSWENGSECISEKNAEICSLPAILKYSLLNSLSAIENEFTSITSTGTRIIISNLRKGKNSNTEFDLSDPTDVLIPDDDSNSAEGRYKREERQDHIPASDYSLRAYLAILYLKPKMQIFLRGQKVKTVVIQKSLSKTEIDTYKPVNKRQAKIVFGFGQNINHYGIMMYHRNRLIKPYVRVGYQLKANKAGVGVIGVIECSWLQPTHNKQDFDYTQLYRSTMAALGVKLNEYWNEKCFNNPNGLESLITENLPDELWVQCEKPDCLKWRKLPDYVKSEDLPEKWYCSMHPSPEWNKCSIPEEEENSEETVKPYQKLHKRYSTTDTVKRFQERVGGEEDFQKKNQDHELLRKKQSTQNEILQNYAPLLSKPLSNLPSSTVSSFNINQQPPKVNTTLVYPSLKNDLPIICSIASLVGSPNQKGLSIAHDVKREEKGLEVKQESFLSIGTKRMPIALSDSDDDTAPHPTKIVCKNSVDEQLKKRLFQIPEKLLEGIDEDIIEDMKSQSIESLGVTLATRSQRLRNLKKKVYNCFKALLNDFKVPNDLKDIDDKIIEEILEKIIQVSSES